MSTRKLAAEDYEDDEDVMSVDEDEDEPGSQHKVGFALSIVVLFALLVGTRALTFEMYKSSSFHAANFRMNESALRWFFNIGLGGSVVLGLLCISLLMYARQPKLSAATNALLPLWMFLFIAVGFALMVVCFKDTCTYTTYGIGKNASGLVNSSGTNAFVHADCADEVHVLHIWPTKPEVAMAISGGLFASFSSLSITTLGMLVQLQRGISKDKSHLMLALGAVCVDLLDWQDFTLTLIDGDVLEGAKEEKAKKSWYCILAWCVVSFLAITCILVYEFVNVIGKLDTAPKERDVAVQQEDQGPKPFSTGEKVCVVASLFFIEIPFLSFRAYSTYRFGAVPSSLILKNAVSIPKEIYELCVGSAVSSAVTDAAGAGEE